jgi:hypothetical protein
LASEAQHVADDVTRRAALLFPRQVLFDHHPRLDAVSLHSPGFDERFPDAVIQVVSLGVARCDHDTTAAVGDEIPGDRGVPQARIRNLDDTSGLLQKLHRSRGTA